MKRIRGEDKQLWEQVKKSVVPLKKLHQPAIPVSTNGLKPKPLKQSTKPLTFDPQHPGDKVPAEARSQSQAMDQNTHRKIARGRTPIEARIDLHGMTQTEAHANLVRFLDEARARQCQTVLVITGKGMLGKGILKESVPRWLKEMPFRDMVASVREAHLSHGGSGALYLRLKKAGNLRR